jgi:putative ABC transport system permease protein
MLAGVLTIISLPVFNQLTEKQISFSGTLNKNLIFYFLCIFKAIILITGFYPAWVLSGFNAKEVLYSRQKLMGRNLFGKSLVILQFSIAIFLMVTTLIYYKQMNFIRTKDLGYNPHEVIQTQIPGDRAILPIERFLKNEFAKEPHIRSVSFGGGENAYEVKLKDRNIKAIHKVIDGNYLLLRRYHWLRS